MHDVCSSANDYSVVSELMDGWGLLAALTKNTHLHTQSSAFCGAHNVIRAMLRDCLPLRFELFFSNAGGRCCAEQQTCMWLSYMSHTAHGARRKHDSKRSSSTAVFWTYNDILLYTPTVCVYILRSRGRHRDATVTHTTQVEWPCAIHPSIHPSSHLTEHYTPHTGGANEYIRFCRPCDSCRCICVFVAQHNPTTVPNSIHYICPCARVLHGGVTMYAYAMRMCVRPHRCEQSRMRCQDWHFQIIRTFPRFCDCFLFQFPIWYVAIHVNFRESIGFSVAFVVNIVFVVVIVRV